MADENVVVDESAAIGPDGNPVVEEAPAEEAVAEAAEAEGAEDEGAESKQPTVVPIGVVQELREELKSVKARAEQAANLLQAEHDRQSRIRAMHERTEAENAGKTAEAQLVAAIEQELGACPDQLEDPMGYRDWNRDRRTMLREAKRDAEISDLKRTIQGRNQQQDTESWQGRVAGMANDFKTAHPDYMDALNHVLEAKRAEAAELGYEGVDAEKYVEEQAQKLTETALKKGQNPAERVYSLAQKTYGWTPKDAPAPATETPKPGTKPAEKLEKKVEGQKMRSMPAGAAQSEALPDLAEIDKMPWDEYQRRAKADPKFRSYVDSLLKQA